MHHNVVQMSEHITQHPLKLNSNKHYFITLHSNIEHFCSVSSSHTVCEIGTVDKISCIELHLNNMLFKIQPSHASFFHQKHFLEDYLLPILSFPFYLHKLQRTEGLPEWKKLIYYLTFPGTDKLLCTYSFWIKAVWSWQEN